MLRSFASVLLSFHGAFRIHLVRPCTVGLSPKAMVQGGSTSRNCPMVPRWIGVLPNLVVKRVALAIEETRTACPWTLRLLPNPFGLLGKKWGPQKNVPMNSGADCECINHRRSPWLDTISGWYLLSGPIFG